MMKNTTPLALIASSAVLLSSVASADTRENLVFGGIDITDDSQAIFIGGVKALNGDLDRTGVVFRGLISSGKYDYKTTAVVGGEVEGKSLQLEAGVGYQWVNKGAQGAVYIGLDHQDHDLTPNDINNEVRGKDTGAMLQIEVAKRNSRVDANLIAKVSDANESHWVRGRLGHQVGKAKVGLELVNAGSKSYDEDRYGIYSTIPVSHKATLNLSLGRSNSEGKNSIEDSDSTYATVGFGFSF